MNVTLRQLRAFVTVSQTGQFTLAAERMHITQPALSTLVRELEGALKVKLLDRHTRMVRLTEAGSGFYAVAEKTLSDLDNAITNTHSLATLSSGRVSIAASTVIS